MEEQNQAANDVLYNKKRQLQQLDYDADVDGQRLSEVQAMGERLDQEIRNLMVTKEELDNVLQTLQQRLSFEEENNTNSKNAAAAATAASEAQMVLEKRQKAVALEKANRLFHQTFRAAIESMAASSNDLLPMYENFCREAKLNTAF